MNKSPYISVGEIIHDHFGSYITVHSGKISKDDIDKIILKDTRVGLSEIDNIVIDFGLSDTCPYYWVCYSSKESLESVSFGRSHAVYTNCSLESLYDFESLLYFSFANSTESRSIVCGNRQLRENRYIDWVTSPKRINIDKELMTAIITFILKKKRTGFKNFLYIAVPDSVIDYQEYCIAAVSTLFSAIPVGMRKQFRIATNAAEENEGLYHILFCKESVINARESKVDVVCLNDTTIPDFLKKANVSKTLEELISRCVNYPQGTRNSDIDTYYSNMEQQKKDIASILERDYINEYDILKLEVAPVTPKVLKEYEDKLANPLSNEQREMLQKQIIRRLSNIAILEENIDNTETNLNTCTFEGLIKLLGSYGHLIDFLQQSNIFFSETYLAEKVRDIKEEYLRNYTKNEKKSSIAQQLEMEQSWNSELTKSQKYIEQYFWKDAINPFVKQCELNIANLKADLKTERLNNWRQQICKEFSVESINQYCSNVRKAYPDELPLFCDGIMQDLSQSSIQKGNTVELIEAILHENSTTSICSDLYIPCAKEMLNSIIDSISEIKITSMRNRIIEWFGAEYGNHFISKMVEIVTSLFEQGKQGNGCCAHISNTEILKILATLSGDSKSSNGVWNLEYSAKQLVNSNLKKDGETVLQEIDWPISKIETWWASVDEYLCGNNSATSLKAEMVNALFAYVKKYAERSDIEYAIRKDRISQIWDFVEAKNAVTPDLKLWHDNWIDESKKEERRNRIKKYTNDFLTYLYACKYHPDAVEKIGKKVLRKQVLENYSATEYKNYSVASYLNAISYIEDVAIDDLMANRNPNLGSNSAFYRQEFINFCKEKRISIVLSDESNISYVLNQIDAYSYFDPTTDRSIVVKYYNKKRGIPFETSYFILSDVIEDLIYLRSGSIIGNAEDYFHSVNTQEYVAIWKFLINANIINDKDIHLLLKAFAKKKSAAVIAIVEFYESRKRKKSLKAKGLLVASILAGILFAGIVFGAGYKLGSAKANVSIEETEISDTSTENTESSNETESESENDASSSSEVETETNNNESSDADISDKDAESEDNETTPVTQNAEENVNNIRYGKIHENGKAVRIRAGVGTDAMVIAQVSNEDDLKLILCDDIIVTGDGLDWQKVLFEEDFTDSEGNFIHEGTEAYVAAKYIMPIE